MGKPEDGVLSELSQSQGEKLHDSTYMKYLERTHSWGEEEEWGCQGGWREE
jgi:hypothetical protein